MRNRAHRWAAALAMLSLLALLLGVQSAVAEGPLPEVLTGEATNVQTTTATLNGAVDPEGLEVTGCRFEYGTVAPGLPPFVGYAEFDHEAPCAPEPGSGSGPVAVSAQIAGLQPNTYYFYRLAATNANGANTSTPGELITLSPPVIEREEVVKVGYSTATLQAEVEPAGFATTYRFEYGITASYGSSVPVPNGKLAAGRGAVLVSEPLVDLAAGVTYHYRVTATNAIGTVYGPDQTFAAFAEPSAPPATCPNISFRNGGLSENLPDCRAYELVSPLDKNDADVIGQNDTNLASASGDGIVFGSRNSFGDTRGSGVAGLNQYVATRGPSSWQTHAVMPTPAPSAVQIFFGSTVLHLFSSELDYAALEAQQLPEAEGGVPNGVNLYRESTTTDQLWTLTNPQAGLEVTDPFAASERGGLTGGSADELSVIAFQSTANFLPEATGSNPKLYVFSHGSLGLAGILPDGSMPAGGSTSVRPAAYESRNFANTVSADGSRVFFVAPGDESTPPQLYVRENGQRTLWISHPDASMPTSEPRGVEFRAATADGSEVVFSSEDPLLPDDPAGLQYGLYLYTAAPSPGSSSNLTFIGRYAEAPEVLGMSTDARRIYFRSGSTLSLWDEGTTRVVTTRFAGGGGPEEALESGALAVSTDGERMAFIGTTQEWEALLSGRASRGAHTEMYLYEAPTQTLTCVSCPGDGAAVSASIQTEPRATAFGVGIGLGFQHRFISDNGRYVFFNTPEALVPRDTNGLTDAYEYNTETGSASLLSSGTGDHGAWFVEASTNGDNAFFVTQQSYSRADRDSLVDLYDARVNGGLPESPPPPVPCAGDACQGVPSATPSFNTASGFSGIGNLTPGPVAKQKHKSKPRKHSVKRRKHHRMKEHHPKQPKSAARRASRHPGR
jgi:hypothetical protein